MTKQLYGTVQFVHFEDAGEVPIMYIGTVEEMIMCATVPSMAKALDYGLRDKLLWHIADRHKDVLATSGDQNNGYAEKDGEGAKDSTWGYSLRVVKYEVSYREYQYRCREGY